MNCICLGLFLITNEFILGFTARGIFFGYCYFPFNFFSGYEALLSLTDQNITKIVRILSYLKTVEHLIGSVGLFLWLFPLVFITIYLWITSIYIDLHGRLMSNLDII